ncbi:MAG TPA: hypothetical protein VGR88_03630 [Ktedonobacterales bacterium]|nr:hypothetical protein [Ktedonobacterales bacterium]
MQALQFALFIVLLELTAGSFISLFLLDLRGDTTRGFVVFQGALYLGFAVLALLAMNAFATPELTRGDGLNVDGSWLDAQRPLLLAAIALLLVWNLLLWRDKQPRGAKKPRGAARSTEPLTANKLRLARSIVGALTAALWLVALFAVGMAYRTLGAAHLDGAFVVLTFVAGGIALGSVMTAMLLGHWYLNTPTASGKPLEFSTALVLVALVLELAFSLAIGPSTAHATTPLLNAAPGTTIASHGHTVTVSTPTVAPNITPAVTSGAPGANRAVRVTPLSTTAMQWLQVLMGILSPLILGGVALWLTRGRSFQSATGMLYLCVAFIFIGEILGRGLLIAPIFS